MSLFTRAVLEFKNNWHHDEWNGLLDGSFYQSKRDNQIYAVPDDQPRVYNKWVMLEAPRSHAKSTTFTVNYPLWEICRNRNVRIVIVSAAQTQSEAFLREITGHLERNEMIKSVYGSMIPQMPEKWTNREIIVDRTDPKLKDATVSATSTGGTVLARRADIIICDDILNEANTHTAEQRQKTEDWFWKVLLPVLEPDGRLIVVGTAWNVEDLYQKLLDSEQFTVRKVYKAVTDIVRREVLWPERWSYDTLMDLKRAMGSLAFNQAYQNEALSAEDAVFQIEWVNEAKKKGRDRTLIRALDYSQWDLGKLMITAGVDLAISQKDGSDYTAMAVIGRTRDGIKMPLYLSREKFSPAETRKAIIELWQNFQPSVVMVENNAYQEAMRRDLADATDIPIKGYTTGGEKFDAEIGINSLAVEFENGKWILPFASRSPQTIELIDILVSGMLKFPSGHTEDLLMALWFANNAMRDLTAGARKVGVFTAGTHGLFGRANVGV